MSIIKEMSMNKLFSENTETAINIFCNKINNSNADLFIVMAQKAVCLFRILLNEGKLNEDLENKYISSSALEFGADYFTDKKIVIVDDIIISGSSLAGVINKLINAGVDESNVEIIALVRNVDYQTMEFRCSKTGKNILNCCLEANDAECIEMSYDISHIFAYDGKPFDTDFPLYTFIELDNNKRKQLFNSYSWDIFEITNNINKCGNIESFALFPKENILERLKELLNVDITEIVNFKIRLYIKTFANKKSILNFVPMALFNETSSEIIEDLYEYFSSEEMKEKFISLSLLGKLRYLQFYFASIFQQVFIKQLENKDLKILSTCFDVVFGYQNSEVIRNSMIIPTGKEELLLKIPVLNPDDLGYTNIFSCEQLLKENDNCGFIINEALFNAIKWWYEEYELPAREILKNRKYNCVKDYDLISKSKSRLKIGFSFAALKNIIKDAGKFYNLDYLVSLFLDRGIDEGIVVPINCYNEEKHLLYRAYRHGEDLPFGEADKSRLIYFLKKLDYYFRKYNGDQEEKIASVSFEKMIVLLFQLGLKNKQIFNRFLGFDNDPILQQRFSVHGIVASVKTDSKYSNMSEPSHVYLSEEPNNDITHKITILFRTEDKYINCYDIDNKFLFSINTKNVNSFYEKNKLNNISKEIKDEIKIIASIIAKWYIFEIKDDGKDKFKDNITALTSCNDIFTFSSSISTALHYFKTYWEREAKVWLTSAIQGEEVHSLTSQHLGQTLPSARKKHNLYINGEAHKTIKYVLKLFNDNELLIEKNVWNDYFRSELTNGNPGTNELNELKNIALKYLYFYSECYDWLVKKIILSNEEIKMKTLFVKCEYYKMYSEIKTQIQHRNFFDVLSDAEKEVSFFERINKFINAMDSKVNESEGIIEQIEDCISEKSTEYTVEYNSALIVELHLENQKIADDFFRTIWKKIEEDKNKTLINIIKLNSNDEFQRYAIFYENISTEFDMYLLDVYKIIFELSCYYLSPTRSFFIPCFPKKMTFKHNLKSNIIKYATKFSSELVKYTSCVEYKKYIHQLILFKTWDVSERLIELTQENLSNFTIENDIVVDDELEFKYFVLGEVYNDSSKLLYSSVKINVNETHAGTGVLFQYNGVIYCISCQHLLDKKEIVSITATSSQEDEIVTLKPLNYIRRIGETQRYADNEVLIFEVEINDHQYFDNRYIFKESDCENNLDINDSYCLFGFGNKNYEFGNKEDNIKLKGSVARGYIKFESEKFRLEPGFSGSGIISESTKKLIGIHAQYKNEHKESLSIPIRRVLNILRKIK